MNHPRCRARSPVGCWAIRAPPVPQRLSQVLWISVTSSVLLLWEPGSLYHRISFCHRLHHVEQPPASPNLFHRSPTTEQMHTQGGRTPTLPVTSYRALFLRLGFSHGSGGQSVARLQHTTEPRQPYAPDACISLWDFVQHRIPPNLHHTAV